MKRGSAFVKNTGRCIVCGRIVGIKRHVCIANESERFLKRVKMSNGCWEWIGCKFSNGYGDFCVSSKNRHILAHRYSYEKHIGKIPAGLCVMHTCDNRGCVNPGHLCVGTKKDNTADMIKKGRAGFWRKSHLNDTTIREIRRFGLSVERSEMAKKFRTSKSNIGHILNRKTWAHVQ